MWLFLIFLAVPIIEIALFIQVGGAIGLWPTLGLVLLAAVAGIGADARRRGCRRLAGCARASTAGGDPVGPIAHGALILVAGMLLLIPGFFTDALGLAAADPGGARRADPPGRGAGDGAGGELRAGPAGRARRATPRRSRRTTRWSRTSRRGRAARSGWTAASVVSAGLRCGARAHVLDRRATPTMHEEDAMADETNGAAARGAAPRLQILTQYIRDLSFENIAAQKGVGPDGKPDIKVQVNLDAQQRGRGPLRGGAEAQGGLAASTTAPVFILELDYAGLFLIQNVPAEQLHPLLMIECPRLIFPFVRRIVGDVTRDGGYPPLNLEHDRFPRALPREIARRQAEAAKPPAQA